MPFRSGVCRLKIRNRIAGSLLLLLAAGCCRADTFTVDESGNVGGRIADAGDFGRQRASRRGSDRV